MHVTRVCTYATIYAPSVLQGHRSVRVHERCSKSTGGFLLFNSKQEPKESALAGGWRRKPLGLWFETMILGPWAALLVWLQNINSNHTFLLLIFVFLFNIMITSILHIFP